jgi:hypothetical protein
MWKLLPCLALTLLTACQPGRPKPDLTTAQLVGCVANLEVSASDQADAARELNTLKEDSVIANTVVPDWIRMRQANKACAK